jgi:hypothetical protein
LGNSINVKDANLAIGVPGGNCGVKPVRIRRAR